MQCDMCEIEEAAFMLGNMQTGDQKALGPACMGRLGLAMAKTILPAEEIAAELGPMFVEGSEGEAVATKRPPKRARSRQEAAEPETRPETPEGLAEPAAASEDG